MSRFNTPTRTVGRSPSHGPPDVRYATGIKLARALGWFSIGLGAVQLIAPKQMARVTGVHHPALMQMYGLREIGTGIGILSSERPAAWLWGRVAGDLIDLTTLLGGYVEGDEKDRSASLIASAAVAGVTTLDVVSAFMLTAAERLES